MKSAGSVLIRDLDGLRQPTRQPLSIRVEDRLRRAILEGNLSPGTRLPSSRVLARDFKVSRYTVEGAFDRLEMEGLVVRRRGSGTFVVESLPDRERTPALNRLASSDQAVAARANGKPRLSRRGAGLSTTMFAWSPTPGTAFTPSLPAPDLFPREIWGRLLNRAVRRPGLDSWVYGPSGGLPELREAIAAHIGGTRAVSCTPDQVIVLSSAHQAVDLILRVLTDEGDPVWMENPCYPPIVRLVRGAGVRIVPVPVDVEGMNVERAIALEPPARLAYVTPSHQYPTGDLLSLERRTALLEWAVREDGWIIEDDYDGDLHFEGRPLAPLQRLDPAGRVIYVGTFSKMMFPSLRVAFLVAPQNLVSAFRKAKHSMDGHAPGHTQSALADFIMDGHLATHLRRIMAEYDRRRLALLESLSSVADLVTPGPSDSGLQLSVYLRKPADDRRIALLCRDEGIDLLALSKFYLETPRDGFVMGFACSHPARTQSAMRIVERVIRSCQD
jgi:GntR family transcriptional regulator/MocR family aminotransferase